MTCDTGNVLGLTVENPDGNSFGKVGNVPQKPMGKSCSVGAFGDIAAGCTPHILLWSLSLIYCHFFGEVTNTLQEKMTIKPISLSTSPTILWPQRRPHFPQGWSSGRVEPSGLSPWCLSFFYLNLQQFYAYVVLFLSPSFFWYGSTCSQAIHEDDLNPSDKVRHPSLYFYRNLFSLSGATSPLVTLMPQDWSSPQGLTLLLGPSLLKVTAFSPRCSKKTRQSEWVNDIQDLVSESGDSQRS